MKHIRKLANRINNKSVKRVENTTVTSNKKIIKAKVKIIKKPVENPNKKPLVNIITRTSGRPNGFKRCHESILNQSYVNIRHIVSVDNIDDLQYVQQYNVDYFFIDKEKIANQPDIPDPKTGKKFIYNLYFNELFSKVDEGWILILDDDDYLAHKNVILKMVNTITSNRDMIIFQMKYPNGSVLPTIQEMGHAPRLGRIGSPCILVHSGIAKTIRWDGWKCGDFRYINKVWKKAGDKKWIKQPLVQLGGAGFGMRRDSELVIRNPLETSTTSETKSTDVNKILDGFNKKFNKGQKKMSNSLINSTFDIVTIIASYNRFNKLYSILQDLHDQPSDYTNKIIVIDDGSSDSRYLSLTELFPNVIYIKNKQNNGKQGYWKTINNAFSQAKSFDFKWLLQIDDDFVLADNFVNSLVEIYNRENGRNRDTHIISYHLTSSKDLTKKRWGCRYWVDGGGFYDRHFIDRINYQIDAISPTRWKFNNKLSSGVWQQVSNKSMHWGYKIFKPKVSLAMHNGNDYSAMARRKRQNDAIYTYNFRGNTTKEEK